MQRKTQFRILRTVFYITIFLAFVLVPYGSVAEGIFRCPSTWFGLQCPGCGVTRALSLLCHGRFGEAWQMNSVFCGVILPLLGGVAVQDTVVTVLGGRCSFLEFLLGISPEEEP